MRWIRLAVLGLMISAPVVAIAQPPMMERGGGERGERGRGMFGDPSQMFDRFAKGKEYIDRNELDPMQQMFFDRMTQGLNISNGRVTRDQFKTVTENMMSRMRGGGMGGGPGGPGGPGAGGMGDMSDRFAEDRFRQSDKNGDGLLQNDEMSESLRSEKDKWDTDKDGYINLTEYKSYMKARFSARMEDRGSPSAPAAPTTPGAEPNVPQIPSQIEPDLDRRPVVFRAGFLPKELPPWFAQLDTDVDGQVGLYEWVKGQRTLPEFREMDCNDDSFLTAEEVLRFIRDGKPQNMNTYASNASPSFGNRDRGGDRSNGNGGGGDRFGKKGDGNGGGKKGDGKGDKKNDGPGSNGMGKGGWPGGGGGGWPGGMGGRSKGGEKGSDKGGKNGRN